MADYLNNIVNKNPLPIDPGNNLNRLGDSITKNLTNFEIPKPPNPNDALKGLEGKIPNKELADKAAAKFKEIQDKFNKLKKTKVNIKKPKVLKTKEIPVPKKFKKAELEKFKGLAGKVGSLKEKAIGITDKAKGALKDVKSQAQGLASQAQGLASQAQGLGVNLPSQIQSNIQNVTNQLPK